MHRKRLGIATVFIGLSIIAWAGFTFVTPIPLMAIGAIIAGIGVLLIPDSNPEIRATQRAGVGVTTDDIARLRNKGLWILNTERKRHIQALQDRHIYLFEDRLALWCIPHQRFLVVYQDGRTGTSRESISMLGWVENGMTVELFDYAEAELDKAISYLNRISRTQR